MLTCSLFRRCACIALSAATFATGFAWVARAGAGQIAAAPYFYLAIGGSESLGFQPTPQDPRGQLTDEGYANDLVADGAAQGTILDLTEIGCPGETTSTMLNGDDHCYDGDGSQLASAMSFLSSHAGERGIVTIDLGFNDVRDCLSGARVNEGCVKQELEIESAELTMIVQRLKLEAGPEVAFVGVGHYDPFLADELRGGRGTSFAKKSASAIDQLNAALGEVYSSEGIPMAEVDDSFGASADTSVVLSGYGVVPSDVAQICQLTWMCAAAPYGPDIHPNDAGYLAIAAAIDAVLPVTT